MATDWNEHASQMFKLWSDGQRAWLESLGRFPGANVASATASQPSAAHATETWSESVNQLMTSWTALLQQATPFTFSTESMKRVLDPSTWATPAPGSFDFGFERLIEGPTFASTPELQIKMAKLQQLAQQRTQDSAAYHAVVLSAWQQAVERFIKQLSDPQAQRVESFRALIDRWVEVANDALLEVHRSAQFLDAQRRVTRSATEYRLLEREIAEAYCEVAHIPTRSEMDEMQRRLIELRREVRSLRRRLDAREGEAP
jgi:hypothetical protein